MLIITTLLLSLVQTDPFLTHFDLRVARELRKLFLLWSTPLKRTWKKRHLYMSKYMYFLQEHMCLPVLWNPCKTLGEESLLILALGHNASLLLSIHGSPSILCAEGHMMTRWEVAFIVPGGGNTATKESVLYFSCIGVQQFCALCYVFFYFLYGCLGIVCVHAGSCMNLCICVFMRLFLNLPIKLC